LLQDFHAFRYKYEINFTFFQKRSTEDITAVSARFHYANYHVPQM
jgi:hypothetical protein